MAGMSAGEMVAFWGLVRSLKGGGRVEGGGFGNLEKPCSGYQYDKERTPTEGEKIHERGQRGGED